MTALQIFKQAGVWDNITNALTSDYVKYPLIGAGLGGLASGVTSYLGGNGDEGNEETPEERNQRILLNSLKGAGYGAAGGLGLAGAKSLYQRYGKQPTPPPDPNAPPPLPEAKASKAATPLTALGLGGVGSHVAGRHATAYNEKATSHNERVQGLWDKSNAALGEGIPTQVAGKGGKTKTVYRPVASLLDADEVYKAKGIIPASQEDAHLLQAAQKNFVERANANPKTGKPQVISDKDLTPSWTRKMLVDDGPEGIARVKGIAADPQSAQRALRSVGRAKMYGGLGGAGLGVGLPYIVEGIESGIREVPAQFDKMKRLAEIQGTEVYNKYIK
jgi:hypothetical protein